ncbi:MAG: acyl-CoA/acyl-ACP dehydrogenase [Leptospirales bacterium]|nr:acyl-CoA/acyl-ACP dehydrogenase [Leptospirales bacterium]
MDFDLSNEDQEFVTQFRRFCDKEIGPAAAEADLKEEIPRDHYKKLGAVGYNGLLHKREFGGQEATYFQATLAQIVLSEYCGSTFFSVGASCGLFGGPVARYANPALARNILPGLLRGETIGCLAVTEPDTGSDVSAIRCKATRSGDGYVLNGQKTYITNAPICDFALVLARLETGEGAGSLTCFVVDTSRPGVVHGKPMKKMGLRASPTGELFFENCKLDPEAIVGRPGQGFRMVMETFQQERLALSAYCTGVMQACFDHSRRYSKERKAFGRPIAKHQSVAFMLADMKTKLEASYLLLMETAWLMDRQRELSSGGKLKAKLMHNGCDIDVAARASEAKLLSSTYAREVANLAVQLHGGAGFMEEFPVARLYRDVKIAEIGGGTSEIQKQIVAHAEIKRVRD